MVKRIKPSIFVWIYAVILLSLALTSIPTNAQTTSLQTSELDATIAVEWMQLVYDRVEAQAVDVPTAARIYGYSGVTLYLAVAPGMSETMTVELLNGLPYMPSLERNQNYDWSSVANGALSVVVKGLFENTSDISTLNTAASNETIRLITALSDKQATLRLRESDTESVHRSLEYGVQLGHAILEWANADGYEAIRTMSYELPDSDNPANWLPNRLGQEAMQPYWGSLRPMILPDAQFCDVALDIPFDTRPTSTFHAQAMEIRDMQEHLTADQLQIAAFWDERPGESGTAAGHWVMVENQLVEYLDLNLEQAAMMYGLLGITFHDAFISTWSLKYEVNLLRPETYIQRYIDPNWQPYRGTPPFPAYPSGHSVLGGAVAEVLTALFGPLAYTDRYGIPYGLQARQYTSFKAAAYENAVSRMYGGVHYRMDIENGLEQGACIGDYVVERLMG